MFVEHENKIDVLSISRNKLTDNTDEKSLIEFIPRRYIDFTHPQGATPENVGKDVAMHLHFNGYKEGKTSTHITYFVGNCVDYMTNRKVTVLWFGQAYLRPVLYRMQGHQIHICGTLDYNEQFHNYSLKNPKITSEAKSEVLKILPIYSSITDKEYDDFRYVLSKAIDKYRFREWIPDYIMKECNLMEINDAYKEIHYPTSFKRLKNALKRLDFEKLLKFSINLAIDEKERSCESSIIPKSFKMAKTISDKLPFELTDDQKNTINAILKKMKSGECENALVQGDVGSGKTIVAIIIMAIIADAGYQSVLVAPTSVLAEQHYNDIKEMLEPLGFNVVFLSSGIKAKEKKIILKSIADGTSNIIIGTHSVLNDSVEYNNLGVIVTDEEHKFGVVQREKLKNKTNSSIHSISMSATPIPRTLATTFFGTSVDVYTIKQKPNGRLPIKTAIINNYEKAYGFLNDEIKKGYQCYIVCPKIDNKEDGNRANVKSVNQVTKEVTEYFSKKNPSVVVKNLTGKTKVGDKSQILNDFSQNKIQVLISTTVIEVGVNVPNATTIAISNAEYFGLASLHQLRGRVGRSNIQSYCILISSQEDNKRLEALVETNDGFEIAKRDLAQRGSGDVTGTSQSGFTEEVAILLDNPKMFEYTQKYAKKILSEKYIDS